MTIWSSAPYRPTKPDSVLQSLSILLGAIAFAALIFLALAVPQ